MSRLGKLAKLPADSRMGHFGRSKYFDNPPHDKYNLIYIILLIHGIGTLLPWNMYITANDYFKYKVNATDEVTTNHTALKETQPIGESDYTTNLLAYIATASKVPNILFQGLNFFYQSGCGTLDTRIVISILLQLVIFILTVVLAIVHTSVECFFWMTMGSVVVINIFNGVYQNCLFGSVANMPMKYTNAVVIGTNVSGVFTSIISIISVFITPSPTLSAIYYFSTAAFYLLICLGTYFYVLNNDFFRYQRELQDEQTVEKVLEEQSEKVKINLSVIGNILKIIWPQCLNILLIFFVSLSMFPNVMANVQPTGTLLSQLYFSKVACFLLFNLFSMIGNYASDHLPKISPRRLWIPIVLRFFFIPLTLLCNYQPGNPGERVLPVLLPNDIVFMIVVSLCGLTGGHLTSLAMMYAPKSVESKYQPTAGMIASFCLMVGILIGVNFSIVFPYIVNCKVF